MTEPTAPPTPDAIPTFRRQATFESWNRFAAVNDEFFPIHMDDEAGRTAGYPAAVGMGNLTWSYFHEALRRWAGEEARVLALRTSFRSPVVRGDTVVVDGHVIASRVHDDRLVVELELHARDSQGNTVAPASATVALPPATRTAHEREGRS